MAFILQDLSILSNIVWSHKYLLELLSVQALIINCCKDRGVIWCCHLYSLCLDKSVCHIWKSNASEVWMFIVKRNSSKLFVLWDECYLTAISVGLSAGPCHMLCQECVYTKNHSHWVTPYSQPGQQWRHAAASAAAWFESVLLLLVALPSLSATS